MRVTLLGTGCPQAHPARFGPASLVRAQERAFLVDCGAGVTQRLVSTGCPGRDLDGLLLTHLHSDHVIDLYQLIISSWHQGRGRPQRIFGPRGTEAFAARLMDLWRSEREQRIAYERRPSLAAFDLEISEFEEGLILDEAGVRIFAFEVDHRPFTPAFGFVVDADGQRLAFSGDTTVCDNLVRWARGCDALVHECFVHGAMAAVSGVRSEATIGAVAAYHTSSCDVGKVAREAGAAMLVLNHFVPADFDREALLDEVRRDYDGPVVIGEDLTTLDLDRGTVAFAGLRLGFGRDQNGGSSP
jgi:ribonuclease Z